MRPCQWSARRVLGFLVLALGGTVAILLWAEIGYRLELFFVDYAAVLGRNHIDDRGFHDRYVWGVTGAIVALTGGLISWRRQASYFAVALMLLNITADLTFFFMHHWRILIEYSEWVPGT